MLTGFYLLAMLLVPYPFASILSIVFPSLRFLWNLHAFIFGLRAVYSFACFASQTQGLCSAFPRPSLEFVRFCLSRIVLRTSPHKHRVCAVLLPSVPFEFVRVCVAFCYTYFASQTSGLCSACTSVPFGILHACVFMSCVLRLANTRFVQCFSLGPF